MTDRACPGCHRRILPGLVLLCCTECLERWINYQPRWIVGDHGWIVGQTSA